MVCRAVVMDFLREPIASLLFLHRLQQCEMIVLKLVVVDSLPLLVAAAGKNCQLGIHAIVNRLLPSLSGQQQIDLALDYTGCHGLNPK